MSDVPITAPGGMTFNLIFDAAADAAPAAFRQAVEDAAALLSSSIKNQITVNLKIDYSGVGGVASAAPDASRLISYEPIAPADVNTLISDVAKTPYATKETPILQSLVGFNNLPASFEQNIRQDLINSSGSNLADVLPDTQLIQGAVFVQVWNSELKLFGLMDANDTTTDDGNVKFNTDIPQANMVGVALHELTHAMGRVPDGPEPDIFDLFRFSSSGKYLFDGTSNPTAASPAPASYFSLDNGVTKLADYGTTSDPSDYLNTGVQGGTDAFNEFYDKNTNQYLSTTDLIQLEALGFDVNVLSATTADDLSADIKKIDQLRFRRFRSHQDARKLYRQLRARSRRHRWCQHGRCKLRVHAGSHRPHLLRRRRRHGRIDRFASPNPEPCAGRSGQDGHPQ